MLYSISERNQILLSTCVFKKMFSFCLIASEIRCYYTSDPSVQNNFYCAYEYLCGMGEAMSVSVSRKLLPFEEFQ